jgi:ATP-dependent DNA helicase RecG
MNIFVRMFDDRLAVESPGPFPPLVTPDNIYDVHHRRNYFLMDAMLYLDFVKCENEGTRRMREEMLAMNLPAPEFSQKEIGSAIVRVTFHNNRNQRKEWMDKDASHLVGEELFSRLTEQEKRCINYAAEYGTIKATDAQRIIDAKTWHSGNKILSGLVDQDILEYHSRFPRDPKANYQLKPRDKNGGQNTRQ